MQFFVSALILFCSLSSSYAAKPWQYVPGLVHEDIAECLKSTQLKSVLVDLPENHFHGDLGRGEESLKLIYQWALQDQPGRFSSYEDFLVKHTVRSSNQGGLVGFLENTIPVYAQSIGKNPSRIRTWFKTQVLEAHVENITRLSLRFSPGWLTMYSGLNWNLALNSVLQGLRDGLEIVEISGGRIELQLILIATRELGEGSGLSQNIKFYLENRNIFAAFDIAGNEQGVPMARLVGQMKPLHDAKRLDSDIHITIHAGETGGTKSVMDALGAGKADRIGHGVQSHRDIRKILKKHPNFMVENAPTINLLLVPELAHKGYPAHPLPTFLRAGVNVSINTDDPAVIAVRGLMRTYKPVTLLHEYGAAYLPRSDGGMGLSIDEIKKLKENGIIQFEYFQPKARPTLNTLLRVLPDDLT